MRRDTSCAGAPALSVSCTHMNRLIIIAALFLVGCNPIPFHRTCDVPKFEISESVTGVQYFDSTGYFSDYCPDETPEKFTYMVNEHISIDVRIRGDWIDLMPLNNGSPIELSGPSLRPINFEGYTQAARIDSLNQGKLILILPSQITIEMNFRFIDCTCAYYDAI